MRRFLIPEKICCNRSEGNEIW